MRALAGALTIAVAGAAAAQPLGDGHHGRLDVTTASTVVNRAVAVASDAAAGGRAVVVVDSTGFVVGDSVLLVQTQWSANGARADVGRFELHRIARVAATTVELIEPLAETFRAPGAQLVTVPEHTDVTVAAGASLIAARYDGSRGGVLALLITGTLVNDGLVSATGSGFRGAPMIAGGPITCVGLDDLAPIGGERGEGSERRTPTPTGRSPNDTGGGAGCAFAGGAGGSNAGIGGRGGHTSESAVQGGLPGAPSPASGLVFGGGGGGTVMQFGQGSAGATGGGAIFIRAGALSGSGQLTADGLDSLGSGTFGGSGGAGAGGSIVLELDGSARCNLSARGGSGGAASTNGPGGGGGGGRLVLRASRVTDCPASVAGGSAGRVAGSSRGADPGSAGMVVLDEHGGDAGFVGPTDLTNRLKFVGCGCSSVGPGLLALLLLVLRRRRC